MPFRTVKDGLYVFQIDKRSNVDIDLTIYFGGKLVKRFNNITQRTTDEQIKQYTTKHD